MPRRKKYDQSDLPEPGTVFAMPLADGRIGVCRVLQRTMQEIPCALVAASTWIADTAPALKNSAVRKILVLTHHNWANRPEMLWVSEPPPKEFQKLGQIEVSREDMGAKCGFYGAWTSLAIQPLLQWRWDNEREKVLEEDAAEKALEASKHAEASRVRAEYLAKLSLADLIGKDLFPKWDEYPPEAAKEGCQRIIQSFIHNLNTSSKSLTRDFVCEELKSCVQELNRFDSKQKHFIETEEREDLHEVLEQVLHAAKFPDLAESIEEWRDW